MYTYSGNNNVAERVINAAYRRWQPRETLVTPALVPTPATAVDDDGDDAGGEVV